MVCLIFRPSVFSFLGWFIITQITVTLSFMAELVNMFILGYIMFVTDKSRAHQRKPPANLSKISSIIIMSTGMYGLLLRQLYQYSGNISLRFFLKIMKKCFLCIMPSCVKRYTTFCYSSLTD